MGLLHRLEISVSTDNIQVPYVCLPQPRIEPGILGTLRHGALRIIEQNPTTMVYLKNGKDVCLMYLHISIRLRSINICIGVFLHKCRISNNNIMLLCFLSFSLYRMYQLTSCLPFVPHSWGALCTVHPGRKSYNIARVFKFRIPNYKFKT